MGEARLNRFSKAELAPTASVGLQTVGGRVNVRWDANSAATPMGQLAVFIEFLALTRLWKNCKDDRPSFYTSPNAPSHEEVLGTWLLSILSGHRRYSHVTAIRCDGVNPGLLGMSKMISEDALRRALKAIDADLGVGWLDTHLRQSTQLDGLAPERRPRIVRGGCGFGSDAVMRALEARAQLYLFKLRPSKNVRRHIERLFGESDWTDAGQGWEGLESELALMGWEHPRRVVLIRRALAGGIALAQFDERQQVLGFVEVDPQAGKRIRGYEHAVLVTNLEHEGLTLGQLYRDRADAENSFDELKNQWGWGGFTKHDLHRCRLSARPAARVSVMLQAWAVQAVKRLSEDLVWNRCCEHQTGSYSDRSAWKAPMITFLSA